MISETFGGTNRRVQPKSALTRRRNLPTRAWARAAAFASAVGLTGCSTAVLEPIGVVGAGEKVILLDSLAIMLAIIIPTILATIAFAWWFRASNTKARYLPDWAYSGRLELVVWSIPVLVIMFLGGIAWIGSHDLDPAKPLASKTPPLNVQVVSLDWKWLFIYPDQHVASVNSLIIPAGTPVHFSLTSASVMNAFFVPGLGSMIYTMNGMADQLNLQADRPGDYFGLSTHYSGDGFSDMHFNVRAVTPQAFAGWVQQARTAGPALDAAGYRALSRQSQNVPPFTYSNAAPGLFQDIVMQKLPPGPGPGLGPGPMHPPASVYPKGGV